MNSHTPCEVILKIKCIQVRKVGDSLLKLTNMFEPPHEQYVTEISTAIRNKLETFSIK